MKAALDEEGTGKWKYFLSYLLDQTWLLDK
jgi:hypothetical protein